MPQRLAGFPTGLLSLLGSQSFGEAPKTLADDIQCTVETQDLYLLTTQVNTVQIIAAPANGQNLGAGLVVPTGEVWRVLAGGVFVLNGVGVTGDYTPILNSNAGLVPLADTVSLVASTTRMICWKQVPFWLRAGQELSVYISALVGAPTVSVAALIGRLRA